MSTSRSTGSLSFGPFELLPGRRQLLARGEPVRLGSRALDLLIALTERAGELMSRGELESRLWPHTVVEETSLRVHVSALRRALGDGINGARYIANVPGRGYSFVAPVARLNGVPDACVGAGAACQRASAGHNLPGRVDRVIGRDAVSDALVAGLRAGRLVSLVGAGGMGKTTVALLVARRCLNEYEDGVRFVDFSPRPAGSAVLSTLADALELDDGAGELWSAVQAHVRERRMLLVLDNCEHVVQPVAELVERLLSAAPEVRILATSREALEVQGERVHRLEGLQAPAEGRGWSVEQARNLAAVELFVERASATAAGFELRADNLDRVCDICVRLDGMPLAIELAAARVDALGVDGVAMRLEQMFEMLTRGRRTALPRHRTLLALLDWSHELLNAAEQTVLRRLSMFRASFSLELAAKLCRDDAADMASVIDVVVNLVTKSLIAVGRHGDSLQYRLLHTTRGYAEQKLIESGERERCQRRHAQTLCELLGAELGGTHTPWAGELARMAEDLQLALEWTLAPAADLETSIQLVTNAFLFVQRGGVVRNLRGPMETLFEKLRLLSPPRPHLELRMRTALAFLTPTSASRYTSERLAGGTLELAAEVGDTGDRIELEYALYLDALRRADYPTALRHAHCIRDLAVGPYAHLSVILADRLLALTLHHVGDHAQASQLARRVLDHRSSTPVENRFGSAVPVAVSMGAVLARIRWIEGFPDEARALCDRVLAMLPAAAPTAACQVIGLTALPMALWRGDLAAARDLQQRLDDVAVRSANPHWISLARALRRVLQAKLSGDSGDLADGLGPEEDMALDLLVTLVPEWVTPRTLQRAEAGTAGWCAPEVLRASAERRLAGGRLAELAGAEAMLLRARDLAVSQGARAWQLRIATSLARLRLAQGRPEQGRQPLADVLSRCAEGRQDADRRTAERLLASLGGAS